MISCRVREMAGRGTHMFSSQSVRPNSMFFSRHHFCSSDHRGTLRHLDGENDCSANLSSFETAMQSVSSLSSIVATRSSSAPMSVHDARVDVSRGAIR
jgi:hypothetical protein